MEIKTVKQLSIYSSRRIAEYEFDRMRGIERLYIRICVGVLIASVSGIAGLGVIAMREPEPKP